ncbi:peptidoglycan DD-metalloendopeptidase family protein [Microbacterium sp. NEAU-LLC]|uniref:Peptidoglycan DD-metalloendopeptidase family protein n=1 Tax=Microbacterium helvum TaxID=2773713 RepID=A0ABR8NLA7_9MICO|nr:peptidoglycan DD-metalloendopeptidase family protein [Microbacterium helvum]
MSRRARRVQTGAQAVVAVPPAAPAEPVRPAAAFEAEVMARDESPAVRDTVLAPAEPFELIAPIVDTAPAPAEDRPVAGAVATATSSDWMAETLAKLMAAEAAAVPAPAPVVIEPVAPVQAARPEPAAAVPVPEPVRAPEPVRTSEPAVAPAAEPVRPASSAAEAVRAAEPTAEPVAAPQPAAESTRSERPRTERVEPLTGPIPAPAADGVDEFAAAARLFSFTGETPTQSAPDAPASEATPEPEAQHTAPRVVQTRRGSAFRRVATASFSVGVFGVVGLIAVGMTTPVEAVAAVNGTESTLSVIAPGDVGGALDASEIQAYVAPGDVQSDLLNRTENYGTTTTAQLASEAGIRNFSNLFHNDPNSNIQWPFSVGVTMSYGFGMRSGRMHEGIDFTPGAGSPVQAIADGTVRIASESGGAYGVHVVIDHIVDGQLVSSHYAHMQYGSLQVVAGQHVTVGTIIGRTGNTGRSFGAHTHFEIWKNGTTPIDPWPWLQTYTDGTHTVG